MTLFGFCWDEMRTWRGRWLLLLAEKEPFPCSVMWKMEASGCLRTKAHQPFPHRLLTPALLAVCFAFSGTSRTMGSGGWFCSYSQPQRMRGLRVGGLEGRLPGPVLLPQRPRWAGRTGTQCQSRVSPQGVSSSKPFGLILTQQLMRSGEARSAASSSSSAL